ncbi:MAG: hypothetical protein JF887_13120 [Candidatus Dormibacteraeota bacterium]|uniref:Uncharacterized protein n=1 Tax=Candidatus Amunia macphersoniae TaxID=3127014 RepID=A0A934KNU3_9BACT|nr:hypothetical protein [Candidatus Dormibacteraeota bacterium]
MAEPTRSERLDGELRRYFAITTSAALPRRVTQLSARTLNSRRTPRSGLAAGAVGILATAALVVLGVTHLGSHGASTASLPGGSQAAAVGRSFGSAAATIRYPGVDVARLADSGVRLLLPAGHGSAVLSPAQAQAAAVAQLGAGAGRPGPAVLAFAQLPDRPQSGCLCWVVDVPVRGGVSMSPGGATLGTELVLVDSVTASPVAVLSGNGIP